MLNTVTSINLYGGIHQDAGSSKYTGWREERARRLTSFWLGQHIKYLINVYK